jgi:phospholipid/cholesterol/gamma-HCH transport system ATP-binding protein
MNDAVLEFRQVTVEGGHLYDTAIWQVGFRLGRGELALVHLEEGHLKTPLADVAQGLVEPVQGSVCFLGKAWETLDEDAALAARALIGRAFDEPGWIGELDMDDNITLAQRHHTRRPEAEIRDEASELARLFSLPGLPLGKPSGMRAPELRLAIIPALMTAVGAARARGAAILWTTEAWDVWNDAGIKPTVRCKMTGSQLSIVPGG